MKKFYELYKEGLIEFDEVDNYVDTWHNSNTKQSISEFLGFTSEEYALFVMDSDRLKLN